MLCSERDSLSLYHATLFRRQPLGHRIPALWPPSRWPSLTHPSPYSYGLTCSSAQEMSDETLNREFPGSPVVKILHFHGWGPGFNPFQELRSHKPCGSEYKQTNKQKDWIAVCQEPSWTYGPQNSSRELGAHNTKHKTIQESLLLLDPLNRKGNQGWVMSWKLQTWAVWYQSLSFRLPSATNQTVSQPQPFRSVVRAVFILPVQITWTLSIRRELIKLFVTYGKDPRRDLTRRYMWKHWESKAHFPDAQDCNNCWTPSVPSARLL